MEIVKCSFEKFKMMYENAESLENIYRIAKEKGLIPCKEPIRIRKGDKYLYNASIKYENGLQVYKAKQDSETNVYWVNDMLISGCLCNNTQLFFKEGILTLVVQDLHDVIVISKEGVVLHSKSGQPKKDIEELILSEIDNGYEIMESFISTEHFTGSYMEIGCKHIVARFKPVVALDDTRFYGTEYYIAIINKETHKVLSGRLYNTAKMLAVDYWGFNGLIACKYNECSDKSALLDLISGTVLLDGVEIETKNEWILAKKTTGYKEHSVNVYLFDCESRSLIEVFSDLKNATISRKREIYNNDEELIIESGYTKIAINKNGVESNI